MSSLKEQLQEKELLLEQIGNRCYELELENHELLKQRKIKKRNFYLLIILAILISANIFVSGRIYQVKKDTTVINEISDKYKALAEDYNYYKQHSWTLSSYDENHK